MRKLTQSFIKIRITKHFSFLFLISFVVDSSLSKLFAEIFVKINVLNKKTTNIESRFFYSCLFYGFLFDNENTMTHNMTNKNLLQSLIK